MTVPQSGRRFCYDSSMGNVSGLESVDNALRLLLLLAERESVRVSEVAAELDIAPSTAHRLLSTLRQREFVDQEPDRRYVKGAALARLGLPGSSVQEADSL